jgi:CRP-like cAMP-binding protein
MSMNSPKLVYKNRILSSLPSDEIARLARHLKPLSLEQDKVLLNGDFSYAYFLEDGIASVVITVEDGGTVEVGVVGVDGVVGLASLLGARSAPGRTFMQITGSGFRISGKVLKEEFEREGQLRRQLQRYVQAFLIQTSQTAVCNRLHSIEQRLARWLLTCHDRLETDRLQLTQEFLGQMLGASRTTVTLAAGLLHHAGIIDYTRGVVTIRDRKQLEKAACECYGTVRDEFRRLKLL